MMASFSGLFAGFMALLMFVLALAILRRFIRVCPSNQILVITGGRGATIDGRKYGFRLQKGGWTIVVPFLQQVHTVDLTIVPINVRVEGVNSAPGRAPPGEPERSQGRRSEPGSVTERGRPAVGAAAGRAVATYPVTGITVARCARVGEGRRGNGQRHGDRPAQRQGSKCPSDPRSRHAEGTARRKAAVGGCHGGMLAGQFRRDHAEEYAS